MEGHSGHVRYRSIEIAVLAGIVFLGMINLPQPFMGDQALNMIVAKKMDDGRLIYRDIWDLKQPGIFFFFWCGGRLFGFSEIGIHVFELLWMIGFSVFLLHAVKDISENKIVPSIAVLFTVGFYYVTTGKWHQTQTEIIVSFPLFISLWFAYKAGRNQALAVHYFLLSGFFGGVVCVFKIALFPIACLFWVYIIGREIFLGNHFRVSFRSLSFVTSIALGASIPILLSVIYLVRKGVWPLAFWTFFQYPFEAISVVPFRVGTLVNGLEWFFSTFSALFPLAVLGFFVSLKRLDRPFEILLISWFIIGFIVIIFQRISWWQYHYYLLLVPIGVLAAIGVEVLLTHVDQAIPGFSPVENRWLVGIGLVALFVPVFWSVIFKVGLLAMNGWAITGPALDQYRATVTPGYAILAEEGAFLEDAERSEGFFVFGDPLCYLRTGREPAIPLPAGWFTPIACLYDELELSLKEARPQYLFVRDSFFEEARDFTPSLTEYVDRLEGFVGENWRVLKRGREGVWLVRKGGAKSTSDVR